MKLIQVENSGCVLCKQNDNQLKTYSRALNEYFHMNCLDIELEKELVDGNAVIIANEFGKFPIKQEIA